MAWRKDDVAHETVEELQGMLPSPPKPAAKRWLWVGLATTVLGVVGAGLNQTGTFPFQPRVSALAHISMVHHRINSIVAAAVEKGDFNTKMEFLVDDYAEKTSPPDAMGIHAEMKVGGEGKWPKVVATFAAKAGKGEDLAKKLQEIFDAVLKLVPEKEVAEVKKAVSITQDGDSAEVKVVPPKDAVFKKENSELKAAFKEHKPVFHADVNMGRSFEEMHKREAKNAALAPRGVEVKLDAVFANSVFQLLAFRPGASPQAAGMLKVLRQAKVRNEIFYSSEDELEDALPLPPLQHFLKMYCSMLPGPISDSLDGIGEVLDGAQKLVLEGLPYDWEVVVRFDKVDPTPFLEHCTMAS